jgi:hypothetical protein
MTHLHDNPQSHRWGAAWAAGIFALLALATSVLLSAISSAVTRSGADVVGRFVPGWPWW